MKTLKGFNFTTLADMLRYIASHILQTINKIQQDQDKEKLQRLKDYESRAKLPVNIHDFLKMDKTRFETFQPN